MFNSILVVCVGNICRSPTGEELLKLSFPSKKIASAGIAALVGNGVDKTAQEVAFSNGIDLSKHIARQLTVNLCHEFDLILVMESKYIETISRIAPEVRGKTMLYGHWIGHKDIYDPYKKSKEAYKQVFTMLSMATRGWVEVLSGE